MILPQLEEDAHGVDVVGMFFFEDNNYVLVEGDPLSELLPNFYKGLSGNMPDQVITL